MASSLGGNFLRCFRVALSRPLSDVTFAVGGWGVYDHTASQVLFDQLKDILPQLQWLSLDPLHVAFAADRMAKRNRTKPTVLGLVLRSVMGKFSARGEPNLLGKPYRGHPIAARDASAEEQRLLLAHGGMSVAEATSVLGQMDPNTPMQSRFEFARLLAAVAAVYAHRMDAKVEKTTLRSKLFHACAPAQYQWYMNGLRFRASLDERTESFLGVGTTRNEQYHHCLNAHYRTTISVSRRMLAAQLSTWLTTEMAVFARALNASPTRIVRRPDAKGVLSSTALVFGASEWSEHLREKTMAWVSTPLAEQRGSAKRPGPSALQRQVYDGIRARTVKRRRLTVFDHRP